MSKYISVITNKFTNYDYNTSINKSGLMYGLSYLTGIYVLLKRNNIKLLLGEMFWYGSKLETYIRRFSRSGYSIVKTFIINPVRETINPPDVRKDVIFVKNGIEILLDSYLNVLSTNNDAIQEDFLYYRMRSDNIPSNEKSYMIMFENVNDLSDNFTLSNKKFVSIEVEIDGETFKIDHHNFKNNNPYVVNNRLFGRSHMKWLMKNVNIELNNKNYIVKLIDDDINIETIVNDEEEESECLVLKDEFIYERKDKNKYVNY